MFLSKDTNGYWYIYYQNPLTGKRSRTSTGTKKKSEATTFFRSFTPPESSSTSDQTWEPVHSSMTLGEYRDEFIQYAKTHYRPATVRGHFTVAWNEFFKVVPSGSLLSTVDERTVDRFISEKVNGTSVWAARTYYGALASAFQVAVRWRYIPLNPFRNVQKPAPIHITPVFLSYEEARCLLGKIKLLGIRDICTVALCTGMRLGELISLEWQCVDLKRRLVHVRNTERFTTKSAKGRVIPMNDMVHDLLHNYPKRKPEDSSSLVFTMASGKTWEPDCVSRNVKRAAKAAGLSERVHFHTLRHTFASWLVQAGVSLYEVKELLGHSSITTTEIYAHLMPQNLHSTVCKLTL